MKTTAIYPEAVEKWGLFEFSCNGKSDKNPFKEYSIFGDFVSKNENKKVEGFYDGDSIYKVRFMPSFEEDYTFTITGNCIDGSISGKFSVKAAAPNNHGPVRVANNYHFSYEDGFPYYPVGTTCYVWNLQSENLQKQTLATLKKSPFNKIRFCIFPKHYDYNFNEPVSYPFEGTPCDSSVLTRENFAQYTGAAKGNKWNFDKFNPRHFRNIEKSIQDLQKLNIEADLIVMHPYDRWGFSLMDAEHDDLYWNYVVNRFAAYRNVWWSLANEYDLMPQKTIADWERYAAIVCKKDPYNHLRSIHNCRPFYDYSKPWITHCCIQRQEPYKTAEYTNEWRERYKKPIVLDEIAYEGNIQHGWGNISAQELVRRLWEAACRGGYGAHAETFMHKDNILWWSHGGVLHGESPERIGFLSKIMREIPGLGLMPVPMKSDEICATVEQTKTKSVYPFYLFYYSFTRPSFRDYFFDDKTKYKVEVIDTWNMTITTAGIFSGKFTVTLPGREYMAVRITALTEVNL